MRHLRSEAPAGTGPFVSIRPVHLAGCRPSIIFRRAIVMRNIPVLMYHRVWSGMSDNRSKYVVHADTFRRQMKYFADSGFYTPKLADALANSGTLFDGGRKPLLITFDDGYLDTYENALPALLDFGFQAIVFIVTDFSNRTNWWDTPKHIAEAQLMGPRHIREMRTRGIEFGSHGVSHRSLPLVSSDELEFELRRSKKAAEEVLGYPVQYFAYPYGEVDERVKLATISAGYDCAFAFNSGPLHFHADPYEIRRALIGNHSSDMYLYWKLSGVEKAFKWSEWIGKKIIGKQPAYIL
jgi:peptidoglycan/xylan/chitin deacetylase (PgdA/CDA1 family)